MAWSLIDGRWEHRTTGRLPTPVSFFIGDIVDSASRAPSPESACVSRRDAASPHSSLLLPASVVLRPAWRMGHAIEVPVVWISKDCDAPPLEGTPEDLGETEPGPEPVCSLVSVAVDADVAGGSSDAQEPGFAQNVTEMLLGMAGVLQQIVRALKDSDALPEKVCGEMRLGVLAMREQLVTVEDMSSGLRTRAATLRTRAG